jgi:hypothetical protein
MGGAFTRLGARYELKYVVSPSAARQIRPLVAAHLPPDEHGRGLPYPIDSLYLDTRDLKLYRQTLAGEKNRFKLRVRTYTASPADPVFLEVKRRVDAAVIKSRGPLDRTRARQLLAGSSGWCEGLAAQELQAVARFTAAVSLCPVEPLVRVRYQREAYEAPNEPLRITFDTELEHAPTRQSDFSSDSLAWKRTPLEGIVLEVKFTERYPLWVADMIRRFGLQRRSVPKYVLSLDRVLQARRAALSLPARGARVAEL